MGMVAAPRGLRRSTVAAITFFGLVLLSLLIAEDFCHTGHRTFGSQASRWRDSRRERMIQFLSEPFRRHDLDSHAGTSHYISRSLIA